MLQAAPAAPAVPVTEPSLRSEAPTLTQKSKEDLASLIHRPATNLNNLLMTGAGSAIKIQDLARGSGVKKLLINIKHAFRHIKLHGSTSNR